MKKVITLVLAAAVLLSCVSVFADTAAMVKFSDVDAATSVGAAIYKLAEAGVVNGCGDGTFKPDGSLTRAELCKMVNLVFGYKDADSQNFSDVNASDWFSSYVAVAKKAGYISGYGDGKFHGRDSLTREQVCVILSRIVKLYDIPYTGKINDDVSEWAKDAVNKVLANKLMNTDTNGNFRAKQNITRSELAVVLSSFLTDSDDKTTTDNQGGNTAGGNTTGGNTAGGSTGGGSTGGGSTGGGSTGGGSTGGGSSEVTYTVTFDANGGTPAPSAQTVKKGSTITLPAVTKSGYVFDGWYFGNTKAETSVVVNSDMKLVAKWVEDDVIDTAKQEEVVGKLNRLLAELKKQRFNATERKVTDIIQATMNKVLADADNGKKIYIEDYVIDNYGDDIENARSNYKAMTEQQQIDFKSKLLDIDRELIDDLSKLLFGVDNIEDYL